MRTRPCGRISRINFHLFRVCFFLPSFGLLSTVFFCSAFNCAIAIFLVAVCFGPKFKLAWATFGLPTTARGQPMTSRIEASRDRRVAIAVDWRFFFVFDFPSIFVRFAIMYL